MSEKKILKLSPEVVGQIAAGEVVERPAAAIKELVENSMDAGATAITVDIKDSGLSSIRVVDNGSGIPHSELRMAFERHATSKLRTQEDLAHIGTLGFRGEALASIAAVAKVTLVTRPTGEESGMQIVNEGGVISDIRPAACAEGTAITVRDLFFNAPVRRKFMKKPAAEGAQVAELVSRLILSHPKVSFRLVMDGKAVYFSPGDGKQDSAIMSIYGIGTLRQLTRVEGGEQGVLLSGYVGVGEAARGNRAHQHFFLNGRAMRSALLSQALEEGCKQRVMIGRFPMCVLHLSIPFEAVDVNVHPNKWEVRFADERGVADAVRNLVADALGAGAAQAEPPPLFMPPPTPPGAPAQVYRQESITQSPDEPKLDEPQPSEPRPIVWPERIAMRSSAWEQGAVLTDSEVPTGDAQGEKEPAEATEPQQLSAAEHLPELALRPVQLLGSAFNTYIIYESGDVLCLCDQHAMHERIIFDRLMAAYQEGGIAQTLMIPQAVQLTYREYGTFLEHQALLSSAGFDAEDFGEQAVKLYTVPVMLGQPQAEHCFQEALDQLATTGALSDDQRVERIIQSACKHAVKGGERLSEASLIALVRAVLEGNVVPTCPHGRPLMLQLTRNELEKRFQRIPGSAS